MHREVVLGAERSEPGHPRGGVTDRLHVHTYPAVFLHVRRLRVDFGEPRSPLDRLIVGIGCQARKRLQRNCRQAEGSARGRGDGRRAQGVNPGSVSPLTRPLGHLRMEGVDLFRAVRWGMGGQGCEFRFGLLAARDGAVGNGVRGGDVDVGGDWCQRQESTGMAVSDHQRALRLGHPAGLDHTAITTTAGHPREVLQQATPSPAGVEGEQKSARTAGGHPERRGTGVGRSLHSALTLTTAAPTPSAGGLGPAGPTRGRDVPRHAVGHLTPAMTSAPSAPAPSTGPPALGRSRRVHPPSTHAVDPTAGGLCPAWRPHGRAGQAAADDNPLSVPRVHPLWHAPRPQPPALPLLPL